MTKDDSTGKVPKNHHDLVTEIFCALDDDCDQHLSADEMNIFISLAGYEEDEENDWEAEFVMLCSEHGVDPMVGIDFALFDKLVSDKSNIICYCDDELLREIHSKLMNPKKQAEAQRMMASPSEDAPE